MVTKLTKEQEAMLAGERGLAKQMALRLLVDLAAAAGALELVPIQTAHLSGVSPLTGGLGLRRFLAKLAADPEAEVAVPTTLNAAGCDANQYEAMRIAVPGFREQSQEIVALYTGMGVRPIQSCVPYEWDGVITEGTAAWAESNAICFGNSYSGLATNRESGLSALAAALTGYTPKYGLLEPEARRPNLEVNVSCVLDDPTDYAILGDWIGRQHRPDWHMPYGPIPLIRGLPDSLTHEQRKALSAAAANYGSPLVYLEGHNDIPESGPLQARLHFDDAELRRRYKALRPLAPVSLIVIGCPQASMGELRAVAELLKGKRVTVGPSDGSGRPPLWVFTSAASKAIADRTGLAQVITQSGALLLENTCPEVVPYDQAWVKQILTNSMKAEHYLKSGLNRIPTSVMRLADCIAMATGEMENIEWVGSSRSGGAEARQLERSASSNLTSARHHDPRTDPSPVAEQYTGRGLPSQDDFLVIGEAFVTDVPITLLGFVNRETGVVEEPGHPADGESLSGKIAIFPRGSGSTVAPYVLLELFYRDRAPLAIVNTEIDSQCAPACSLEGVPYAYGYPSGIFRHIHSGDRVELRRQGDQVILRVIGP